MKRALALLLVVLLALAPEAAFAHSRKSSHSRSTARSERSTKSEGSTKTHPYRDYGRSTRKRDPAQHRAFQRAHPCPSTGRKSGACPGYIVDHVKALKRGGADRPSNMQWQTVAEGKAKDRVE